MPHPILDKRSYLPCKLWATVISSWKFPVSAIKQISLKMAGELKTFTSLTQISPSVAEMRPANKFKKVVFPAPLWPKNPMIFGPSILNVTFSSACFCLYDLLTLLASMIIRYPLCNIFCISSSEMPNLVASFFNGPMCCVKKFFLYVPQFNTAFAFRLTNYIYNRRHVFYKITPLSTNSFTPFPSCSWIDSIFLRKFICGWNARSSGCNIPSRIVSDAFARFVGK